MGYLKFRQGDRAEALKWYEKAVKLDSQSYLAHYYFGAMAMSGGTLEPEEAARVEQSLRTAIKLNPSFAPAYDRLAVLFGMRNQNLEEAHMLSLQALRIDPLNVTYWLNSANILLASRRSTDAIAVLKNALKVAQSPEDVAHAQSALQMAEQYEAAQRAYEQHSGGENEAAGGPKLRTRVVSEGGSEKDEKTSAPVAVSADAAPRGPRRTLTGTVKQVQCSPPARMEMELEAREGSVTLHSENYYKVQFSAFGFAPSGELQPCTDLEGKPARVEYVEDKGAKQITAVEMRK
jgi:tetratricopeptide (TPR) repeat protein